MAQDGDAENQTHVNEQTPLLEDPQPDQQLDPNGDEPKQKQKQASWYIWRIFWAIVAAVFLAIFIKGWIDAGGDVDVGGHDLMSISFLSS